MEKKGFSLSIEIVVYVLLAILVLATLIFIFQDQSGEFFNSVGRFFKIANGSISE